MECTEVTNEMKYIYVSGPLSQSFGFQMGYEPMILGVAKISDKITFLI